MKKLLAECGQMAADALWVVVSTLVFFTSAAATAAVFCAVWAALAMTAIVLALLAPAVVASADTIYWGTGGPWAFAWLVGAIIMTPFGWVLLKRFYEALGGVGESLSQPITDTAAAAARIFWIEWEESAQ